MTDGSQQPTPPPPPPGGGSQDQSPPPPPGGPAGGAARKKGLPTVAWVGIGCGALLVLAAIAVLYIGVRWGSGKVQELKENPAEMTARAIVAADPDLEMVETDDAEGTITIRNKKTDEVTTVDFQNVKEGKISFKSGDEEVTMGFEEDGEGGGAFTVRDQEGKSRFRVGSGGAEEIPGWVPRYPGGDPEGTYLSATERQTQGGFSFAVQEELDEVIGFYEGELESAGFEITARNSWETGGSRARTVTAEEGKRTIQVMAMQEAETRVTVTFNEEKGQE